MGRLIQTGCVPNGARASCEVIETDRLKLADVRQWIKILEKLVDQINRLKIEFFLNDEFQNPEHHVPVDKIIPFSLLPHTVVTHRPNAASLPLSFPRDIICLA